MSKPKINETRSLFIRAFRDSEDGRRALAHLETFAGMNTPGYYPDSDRTAFMAGHRSVVLYIKQMSEPLPDDLPAQAETENEKE